MPLLTVDLQAINPNWQGKAHFLYHEANRRGGVTFKLEDDKYIYEGEYDFDGGDMAERDRRTGFVEMVPLDVPELTAVTNSDWPRAVYAAGKVIYPSRMYRTGYRVVSSAAYPSGGAM